MSFNLSYPVGIADVLKKSVNFAELSNSIIRIDLLPRVFYVFCRGEVRDIAPIYAENWHKLTDTWVFHPFIAAIADVIQNCNDYNEGIVELQFYKNKLGRYVTTNVFGHMTRDIRRGNFVW